MTPSFPTVDAPASGTPSPSDPDIMARLAAGECNALGALYDRYQARIRRFVARATADSEDVDDIVQVTFLTAAKAAGRYDGRSTCHPWLLGIAVRLLRRRRRALGRSFGVLSSITGSWATAVDPRPTLQARNDVERALRCLSEPKRVAILMAEVEGLSCPEIAAVLQIPLGTVWTRLHAARRELRRALQEETP